MDLTAQQQKVETLTAQVATDQSNLSSDQAALTEAEAELAQGNLINQLEALTADDVTAINAALAADNSSISLSLPPATPQAA